MPSARQTTPIQAFDQDQKVLCFHMDLLYEAKILEIQLADDGSGFQYKVHYKGWKSTWDDWVPAERIRSFTTENKELAAQLHAQARGQLQKPAVKLRKSQHLNTGLVGPENSRASEESSVGGLLGAARTTRRARDFDLEQEEAYHARPSIKLPITDMMKAMLVDDWENITRLNLLVPIPHPYPVTRILADYMEYERPNRVDASASMDVLEETVSGLREYFNRALGSILLYRFERPQWHEILKEIRDANEHSAVRTAADAYGAEHLARLIVSLEELVAHTNMDAHSISRLKEELSKFLIWFTKNTKTYYCTSYDTPSLDYIETARSF